VTIGPSVPQSTIVSPYLRCPFERMTSKVVPIDSTFLTSKTVQDRSEMYIKLLFILSWVNLARRSNMSGIPSPVKADVGTKETTLPSFLFSSNSSELSPASANLSLTSASRFSNSDLTDLDCCSYDARKPLSGVGFQPYSLSIWSSAQIVRLCMVELPC
jgi:hypothetical protein